MNKLFRNLALTVVLSLSVLTAVRADDGIMSPGGDKTQPPPSQPTTTTTSSTTTEELLILVVTSVLTKL